jgi:quinol monooxygenase YgiN
MIVVQGVFRVREADRERYLAESAETQRISRAEPGCLEYVLAADPLDADRVVLSERWSSRAELDAHIEALVARRAVATAEGPSPVAPLSREIAFFEASPIDVM